MCLGNDSAKEGYRLTPVPIGYKDITALPMTAIAAMKRHFTFRKKSAKKEAKKDAKGDEGLQPVAKNTEFPEGESVGKQQGEAKPKKKLSFREPEVDGARRRSYVRKDSESSSGENSAQSQSVANKENEKLALTPWTRSLSDSVEDLELESQAMRIVRTIGQAFEVCHKLSLAHATSVTGSQEEVVGEKIHEATSENTHKDKLQKELEAKNCNSVDERTNNQDQALCCQPKLEPLAPPTSERQQSATETSETYSSPRSELLPVMGSVPPEGTPLSIYHQMQLMREQLEQQTQHTQTALAHVQLLKDQLAAESTARLEAQAQNHQLLVHNKELLEHIRVLVQHIHDLETKVHRLEGKGELPFSDLPSLRSSHQTNDSTSGAVHLPDFLQMEQATSTSSSSKFSSSPVPHLLQNAIPYGSPSGSPRPCNTSHETSVFSGLSLPSSPTQQQSNLDELMLLRRSGSPHVIRNRSPVYSQTDGLTMTIANNGNNNNSLLLGFHPGEMNSAPPRLNPPPQKFKAARPDAEPSITMPSCNGKPSWSESDRHEGALSWSSPPSLDPLSTAQMNLLLRQYGVPSSQHLPTNNNNNTETFFSQAIRDLTKLNLLDRGNAPAVKTSPVVDQTSPSPTSFMRLFKS